MATQKVVKKIRGVYEHPAGSGTWWIQYFDADRKRHREKVGQRSAAKELYRERKSDIRRDVKLPPMVPKRPILFKEIAQDALDYSKAHKASYPGDASTVKHLLPTFGDMKVEDITHKTIKAYLDTRTDLSKTTINRYRGTLSMIFREAIRDDKATSNPARLVRLYKEDNARIRFITFAEEDLIRKIIRERTPTHELSFIVALETGMRMSEQHRVSWDQVDMDRRQLYLPKTKNGDERWVVLTVRALDAFKELYARRGPKPKSQRVFLSRYGEQLDSPRSWFTLVMRDAVKEDPALSDVSWHICRHTYISRLVMGGTDLPTVGRLAGHKSYKMTLRYAHLSPDYLLKSVDNIAVYREQEAKKVADAAEVAKQG